MQLNNVFSRNVAHYVNIVIRSAPNKNNQKVVEEQAV